MPAIAMILHCPKCRTQHIDADEWATTRLHKTHLCLNKECGHLFKPANVHTVGVSSLECLERHIDRFGDVFWCELDRDHEGGDHQMTRPDGSVCRWSVGKA